jgi:hypothetical protein
MNPNLVFLPLCGQVALTFLIWVWMVSTRLNATQTQRVRPQELASDARADEVFKKIVNISDNFDNLFELPVLFFAAAPIIFLTRKTDYLYLILLWGFVFGRAAHSWIHCTNNRIVMRFYAFGISSILLWVIWARIAIQIITQA